MSVPYQTQLIDSRMLSDCALLCAKTNFKTKYINDPSKRKEIFLKLFEQVECNEIDFWVRFCCNKLWNENVEENYSSEFEKKINDHKGNPDLSYLKSLKYTDGKEVWHASLIGCYGTLSEFLIAAEEGRKFKFAIAFPKNQD